MSPLRKVGQTIILLNKSNVFVDKNVHNYLYNNNIRYVFNMNVYYLYSIFQ